MRRVKRHWNLLHREVEGALLLEVFRLGQGFEQSDLEESLPMAGELAFEGPFEPKPFYDSATTFFGFVLFVYLFVIFHK